MECKICKESSETDDNRLITPCKCTGTLGKIHEQCLRQWMDSLPTSTGADVCPLCKGPIHSKTINNGWLSLSLINRVINVSNVVSGSISIMLVGSGLYALAATVISGLWSYFIHNPLTFLRMGMFYTISFGGYFMLGLAIAILRLTNVQWNGRQIRLDLGWLRKPIRFSGAFMEYLLARYHISKYGFGWPTVFMYSVSVYVMSAMTIDSFFNWYRKKYVRVRYIDNSVEGSTATLEHRNE